MKEKSEIKMLQAKWLYDNTEPMTIQIFKLNYDFYYDQDEGYNDENEVPNLNENGEQFVILNNCPNFLDMKSFPIFVGFTMEEAKIKAEEILNRKLSWN